MVIKIIAVLISIVSIFVFFEYDRGPYAQSGEIIQTYITPLEPCITREELHKKLHTDAVPLGGLDWFETEDIVIMGVIMGQTPTTCKFK